MTQAPTPGPLSAEPLDVLLKRAVEAFKALPPDEKRRQFDEQKRRWVAAEMAMGDEGTRLFLAPTAPVEASGSEREAEEFFAPFEAFRPQPSGETREAVARIIDGGLIHYGADGIRIEDLDGKLLSEKYAGMEEASQALAKLRTDAILALLSARPLALGGQQGEAVTIIRDRLRRIWEGDTHLVYSGNPPEPSHDEEGDLAKLANEAVEALNTLFPVPDALSTTPARAEAQDEGAAGEPVAFEIVSYDIYPGACWIAPSAAAEYRKEYGCTLRPLYAHPSPTPAADADRVRIAVEALEKIKNRRSIVFGRGEMSGQEAFGIAAEALAALKSEGK